MTPRRYGPLAYAPITRRPKLTWPGNARVALWVNPNIEFFGLDDVMPGNLNERVPREHARIPNVRNWAVRDYGKRLGYEQAAAEIQNHYLAGRRREAAAAVPDALIDETSLVGPGERIRDRLQAWKTLAEDRRIAGLILAGADAQALRIVAEAVM